MISTSLTTSEATWPCAAIARASVWEPGRGVAYDGSSAWRCDKACDENIGRYSAASNFSSKIKELMACGERSTPGRSAGRFKSSGSMRQVYACACSLVSLFSTFDRFGINSMQDLSMLRHGSMMDVSQQLSMLLVKIFSDLRAAAIFFKFSSDGFSVLLRQNEAHWIQQASAIGMAGSICKCSIRCDSCQNIYCTTVVLLRVSACCLRTECLVEKPTTHQPTQSQLHEPCKSPLVQE